MEKNYLTKEKHEELAKELEDLKFNRRREVAERLETAKALGDLSENAEYHAAREEQSDIEDRISQLEVILKSSEIISMHHSTKVEIGSTLKVRRENGQEDQIFTLVGSEETDVATGKISYQSPLGAGLLGKKEGERVIIRTPRGEITYKILNIQ
jgi:transcription elongation factor GreA